MTKPIPHSELEEMISNISKTSEPDAEFLDSLRARFILEGHASAKQNQEKKMKRNKLSPRLAWGLTLLVLAVLLTLAFSSPTVVNALRRLFGYVPGVGLVENTGSMRVLERPVSVTREGVTLTVTQALVYMDHVQLVYETSGIAPENDRAKAADGNNAAAFCNPENPVLRLPNGTLIESVDEYPENIFTPVYKTSIPADVTGMTVLLKCIPLTRLDAVPENWEVQIKIISAPAGTVIGEPVMDVASPETIISEPIMGIVPSETPATSDNRIADEITVKLEKVVPQKDNYIFYISMASNKKDESLLALYPASAYLLDATGQKTPLLSYPSWEPIKKVELWELQNFVHKPAHGPYTLVVDKVWAYYETNHASFEFDPGQNPQIGQTWSLDRTWSFGGHEVKVVSAQMVERPEYGDGDSIKNPQGYEFKFQVLDGKTPMNAIIGNSESQNVFQSDFLGPFGSPEFSVANYCGYQYHSSSRHAFTDRMATINLKRKCGGHLPSAFLISQRFGMSNSNLSLYAMKIAAKQISMIEGPTVTGGFDGGDNCSTNI